MSSPSAPTHTDVPHATDWWSVATVVVGIGTFALAQGLTYPLISLLLAQASVAGPVIGLNAAAFMVGLGVSVVCLPALTRRWRVASIIIAALGIAALTLVAFAISGTPSTPTALAWWFALRFALGFCVNAIYTLGEAWLGVAASDDVRGRVAGLYSASAATGFSLGPLAIPPLGTQNGLAFAACAATVALVAVAVAVLSRRARVTPAPILLADLPRFARAAPLLLLLVGVYGLADATVLSIRPLHITSGGGSDVAAAMFVSLVHVGMIVAQVPIGWLLDRTDRWRVVVGCSCSVATAFALVSVLPVSSVLMWIAAMIGGAGFFGLYTCALAILGREHRGGLMVAGAAAFSLAYAFGGVVGPPAAGLALAYSSSLSFLPLVLVAIVALSVLLAKRS